MKAELKVRPLWAACLLCLVLMLLAGPPLSAAAAEAESTAPLTEAPVTEAPVTEPPISEVPPTAGEGETAPLSAAVADFFRENSAELISGATFALTLAFGLIFRKKLVPGLFDALAGLLGKSREACELVEAGHAEEKRELSLLLARAEELLATAKVTAERAETVAERVTAGEGESADVRRILTEQAELLYTLLLSANLPQYQKDRIGEAHAAALRALTVSRDD